MNTWKSMSIALVCLGLVAGLAGGCGPATGPSTSMPTAGEDRFYPEGQILVSGPQSTVEKAIEAVRTKYPMEEAVKQLELQLNLETRAKLARRQGTAVECLAAAVPAATSCLVPGGQGDTWAMSLLRFDESIPLWDMIEAFAEAAEGDPCLFAEPNYLAGSPWIGAGSPWIGAGSPWIGAGSPWLGPSGMGADEAAFGGQWALEQIGLVSAGARQVEGTGAGIKIGVFDTWPAFEGEAPFPLTAVTPPVYAPFPASAPQAEVGMASHGLFVAGLIHEVAPDGRLVVYRVLDDNAQGDVFTLDNALHLFITEILAEADAFDGAVINLSLGIYPPPKDKWRGTNPPPEVRTLEMLLGYAHCQGMVVVAAAGNARQDRHPAPDPQIPASYPFVVGVAGSNITRAPSCFSNQGFVAAPAGDGLDRCTVCQTDCEGIENCTEATADVCEDVYVIGPAVDPADPGSFPYVYWAGTSFAAPLVAGQAALLLGEGAQPASIRAHIGDLSGEIDDGDDVVDSGVIDIPGSLKAPLPY